MCKQGGKAVSWMTQRQSGRGKVEVRSYIHTVMWPWGRGAQVGLGWDCLGLLVPTNPKIPSKLTAVMLKPNIVYS